MRSFDVFFDLGLNKRLSKQSRRRAFETPSCSLWRHCNSLGWYDKRYYEPTLTNMAKTLGSRRLSNFRMIPETLNFESLDQKKKDVLSCLGIIPDLNNSLFSLTTKEIPGQRSIIKACNAENVFMPWNLYDSYKSTCFRVSYWRWFNIGSGNGLVRQATDQYLNKVD